MLEVACVKSCCQVEALRARQLEARRREGLGSFDEIDTNGDGYIDRQEFSNAVRVLENAARTGSPCVSFTLCALTHSLPALALPVSHSLSVPSLTLCPH